MNDLVSIITASYNSKETIAKTIESVSRQTYDNIEYICIDGDSRDGTKRIIEKNDGLIDKWISEPDNGIYEGINKGLRLASGNIIGILNSDDWYCPETVQVAHNNLTGKNSPDVLYGAVNIWDKNAKKIMKTYGEKGAAYALYTAPMNHPAMFVKKQVYDEIGTYDTSFETASDYDFMLRCIDNAYNVKYVDRVLTNFRQGGRTSKITGSPYRQIYNILLKNDYSYLDVLRGVSYRLLRDKAATIIECLGFKKKMEFFRNVLPYHKT